MTQEWKPNGSFAEYWRSDNPLISAWYRFGNSPPKNQYLSAAEADSPTVYLSGLMVDSGPHKHHLLPYPRRSTDAAYLEAVPSIAPWDPTGSGCKIHTLRSDKAAGTTDYSVEFCMADPGYVTQSSATSLEQGMLGYGSVMYSGITVIGWAEIPHVVAQGSNTPAGQRVLIGRSDQNTSLSTHVLWRMVWNQPSSANNYNLQFTMLSDTNFTFPVGTRVASADIISTSHPNFPLDRTEPFFFAGQISREAPEENRSFTANGSGILRCFIGTESSGIVAVAETLIRGTSIETIFQNMDTGGVPLGVFGSSRALRNTTGAGNRTMASGSILDEVVVIQDGGLDPQSILHYALSGMTHITSRDPEHPDFEPEFPGSSGLTAYWSFDDDTGSNTAPATINDPRLDLSMSGLGTSMNFIDGINGGRGLRITPSQASFFNSDVTDQLNSQNYPLIPAESGLPLLFPSGHIVDEGMTIIGWARSVPTGTNMRGGAFGWFGNNEARQTFWTDAYTNSSPVPNTNILGTIIQISGAPIALPSDPLVRLATRESSTSAADRVGNGLGLSNSSTRSDPEYDSSDDGWHLWAGVFDIHIGMIYMVKDAKQMIPLTQQMSSASGLLSDNFGPGEAFFGFTPRDTNSWDIDNWAVYNRVLNIAEMSGFALGGISTPAPPAVLSTPMKSLVGFWPLDEFVNYDPLVVSGFRIDDDSWYSHHLTNVSGAFSFGTRLNSEVATVSASLNVDLSGSMVSLERQLHGSNLDGSTSNLFANSGMSAGAWVYLPSGDLGTEGLGSSGLDGDHMIMGAWSQVSTQQSWFLGIRNNKPHVKFRDSSSNLTEITAPVDVEFNTPFFIGCNFFGSGVNMKAQVVTGQSATDAEIEYVIDQTFGLADDIPQSVGASGFSLLNAPNLNYGFPQTTRIGLAYVHLGYLDAAGWIATKRSAIDNITLASGSVSTSDPENISHWKFDRAGKKALDFGREQNSLTPINTDGHELGVEGAYHSSGAVVRQPEYLDSIPGNPQSRRLDLGSGTQSWTALGWVKPPVISNVDEHVILNKGSGPASSPTGIKIFTPADSLNPQVVSTSQDAAAFNGDLAPTEWNHLAVVSDRDNDQLAVIVNGRYAGSSFVTLSEVLPNNSGLALGGRGDQQFDALAGGSAFSGVLDDFMLFSRALTLPEISGLAANSYNYTNNAGTIDATHGMWLSGVNQEIVSGLIGSYMHGLAQDIDLFAGYVSGVSGVVDQWGGFIHGRAFVSGLTGGFTHGIGSQSGIFGHFIHGLGIVSGLIGSYTFGACQAVDEFDVTLTFEIVTSKDFDARLGVEKTEIYDFDSRLGVIRITQPPDCTLEMPAIGLIASGTPYTLTVEGSGIAQDQKKVSKVRFTFADFKDAEEGTLIDGVPFSGLYQASRTFDTPGWYTVKIEVLDSYGYRTSCARPFLLVPSGSTSGAYLATLPGISISGTPDTGSAIHRTFFTHSLSGLDTTSGLLEYTDFADQQETLVNSLEMPSGTQFTDFVRTHDYTMPGRYSAVWAVSGSWGVVSDSLSDGIDYLE